MVKLEQSAELLASLRVVRGFLMEFPQVVYAQKVILSDLYEAIGGGIV